MLLTTRTNNIFFVVGSISHKGHQPIDWCISCDKHMDLCLYTILPSWVFNKPTKCNTLKLNTIKYKTNLPYFSYEKPNHLHLWTKCDVKPNQAYFSIFAVFPVPLLHFLDSPDSQEAPPKTLLHTATKEVHLARQLPGTSWPTLKPCLHNHQA